MFQSFIGETKAWLSMSSLAMLKQGGRKLMSMTRPSLITSMSSVSPSCRHLFSGRTRRAHSFAFYIFLRHVWCTLTADGMGVVQQAFVH